MNINRDNYEEFFILYGDKELSSEDERRVEEFVRQNPDLEPEFAVLNQVRFTVDEEVKYDEKENLFRSTPVGITNEEELLLLAVDNELTTAQQSELRELLERNPAMQSELDRYRKTVFDPSESVIFPNKQLLYRRDDRPVVVPIFWKRFAAAAAVLVAVSVTALIMFNRDTDEHAAVASNTSANGFQATAPAVRESSSTESTANVPVNAANANDVSGNEVAVATPEYKRNATAPTVVKIEQSPAVKKVDRAAPVKANSNETQFAKSNNNLPKPSQNPNVADMAQMNQPVLANNASVKTSNVSPAEKNIIAAVTPATDPSLQYTKNTLPEPGDDMDDQGPRKSKLRGFFRKVTRTFEKNTNIKATDEEDRLLLGGLAIRL